MAWGTRAFAEAERQEMEADSIDMRLPNQALEEVRAFGRAITRAEVDSTKISSTDRDWIAGDTIIARFERIASSAPDTGTTMRLREVQARGTARAFQQLASTDGIKERPNLSYTRGLRILVRFADGEVSAVEVEQQASGLYLEPVTTPVPAPGVRPPLPPGRPTP